MLADSIVTQQGSPVDAATERIQPGPVPDWVVPCSFASDFKPDPAGQVTYLLCDKQLHAEKHQEYTHLALRLETTQAVQRQSEWRIECDPRRQRITVHLIRIHRGEQQFDQTRLNGLRAAAGTSEGRQTLVLLLEDVRIGDVLEWCYTVEEVPVLMAGRCASFYALPEGTSVGKLFFSVRFNESRPMKWKSGERDWSPAEARAQSEVHWVWVRENIAGSIPEENTPEWHVTQPWIQISDCADWQSVAADFAGAWNDGQEGATIKATLQELMVAQGDVLEQADKAIHLVQDEYRCMAEDAELDGEPPVMPEIVARRRFGNGKDLAFLLVQLLRGLKIEARLVLVNTKLRKSIGDLLPSPGLFNHVVVEFEVRGERRWINATIGGQGGGPLNRVIPDYGVGLRVEKGSPGLVPAPTPSIPASAYEIKESVLVDTSGAASRLGVVMAARGSYAEDLRREFERLGTEGVSRRRLQMCIDRFGPATRLGPMQHRDDHKANEFFLAEVFEIKDFLKADAKSGWFKLEVKDDSVSGLLKLPETTPRRSPFALPYPCDATHIFEVYCVALAPGNPQEKTVDNPWLQFTRSRRMLAGNWIVQSTLWTLADAVPPSGSEKHRESVQDIRAQAGWSLMVPAGLARPHQRSDFGTLPAGWESEGAAKRTPLRAQVNPDPGQQIAANLAAAAASVPGGESGQVRYKRRKRHRRRQHSKKSRLIWGACLAGALLVLLIIILVALANGAQHWLPQSGPSITTEAPADQ